MHADMSFLGLFLQASPIVKAVMMLLMGMSIFSWAVIFSRRRILGSAQKAADSFEQRFWSGIDLTKLYQESNARAEHLQGLEKIFHSGFKEYMRMLKTGNRSPEAVMDGSYRSMRVTLSREIESLESQLPNLATIGSISPYIGLFGTVWGIMNSFIALGEVQQATLTMVAPGIAEALIATAIGLFAAIPAVIAFNRFSTQVIKLEQSYGNFMEEFSTILNRQTQSGQSQGQE